ncbi:MAG: hypothetical protein NZM31_01500 [Gemmatales bacterium]|nr:hypothetical protein [Gemmatales bacterium]MDW8385672.1 hypothetical protein [Gemmatales bacterium]
MAKIEDRDSQTGKEKHLLEIKPHRTTGKFGEIPGQRKGDQ